MKGLPKAPKLKQSLNRVRKSLSFVKEGYSSRAVTQPRTGTAALVAVSGGKITLKQLIAIHRTLARIAKRQGTFLYRIQATVPITSKPSEIRMGRGKGPISTWVRPVRPGDLVLEYAARPTDMIVLEQAVKVAAEKLGVRTRMVAQKHDLSRELVDL